MKEKIYLDHLNPSFYRKMRETIITGSPDFLFLVKNGYKRMFHVDLLTLLSSIIHNHIRSCRADGFKGDSIMLLSLDQTTVDCLYELMYKDVCEIDSSVSSKVVQELTELGFPVSYHLSKLPELKGIPNAIKNEVQNDSSYEMRINNQNETHHDNMIIGQHNTSDEMQTDGRNETHNDAQSDDHSDFQNETQNDMNNNVQNDSLNETNSRAYSDTYSPEPPSSTGRKPRGVKVKYPLAPAQEELVKFYSLIEESLPNPKLYSVGKEIRCFHCNQLYPKVRLWKDHIMNDHYHRAQTCENCGEVFTYTFYLHRRTCTPAGGGGGGGGEIN